MKLILVRVDLNIKQKQKLDESQLIMCVECLSNQIGERVFKYHKTLIAFPTDVIRMSHSPHIMFRRGECFDCKICYSDYRRFNSGGWIEFECDFEGYGRQCAVYVLADSIASSSWCRHLKFRLLMFVMYIVLKLKWYHWLSYNVIILINGKLCEALLSSCIVQSVLWKLITNPLRRRATNPTTTIRATEFSCFDRNINQSESL